MVLTIWQSYRSCRIIQKSRKCIFEWSKVPKRRFLVVFLGLVCWIDLVLHIVIVLNVLLNVATIPCHAGSFKIHKNPFLNDQKSQKSHWIGCILHILILINNVHGLLMVSFNFCDINIPKWTSWNWLEVKKSWRELKLSMLLDSVTVGNVALICLHFSGKTALRIFPIFCMNVPYYKVTQRTRRFFREKSSSLIIHENRFLPFWVILINFPWFVLADIAYSARSNRSWSTGNVTRSWRIIQKSQKCIFGWSKEQKGVLVHILEFCSPSMTWYGILW